MGDWTTEPEMEVDVDHAEPVLKFHGNSAKISSMVNAYSLASGHTCPGAMDCLSRAHPKTGKIKDHGEFRCYMTSLEAIYPSMRYAVWHNTKLMKLMKTREQIVDLIERSLVMHNPQVFLNGFNGILRPHIGGDFFSQMYADAMNDFAWKHEGMLVYCYTKSLSFFRTQYNKDKNIAPNFVINASSGGWFPHMQAYFKTAHIVYSQEEADDMDLVIDHDDTLAMDPQVGDFAILLHGNQPKGSHAQEALKLLKKQGFKGYSHKTKSKVLDLKAMDVYRRAIAVTQKTRRIKNADNQKDSNGNRQEGAQAKEKARS